jgi:RNA-binding motif protein, X-linked 2
VPSATAVSFLLLPVPAQCSLTLSDSSPNASWHTDYRDTAFVYFGGLPYDLSEGDVVTIFSQYGEPVFLKLARDQETGKSKGFGWLKYEDQRSTDLAVDNLGGAQIGGRMISVDHARYKARDDEDAEEFKVGWVDIQRRQRASTANNSGDSSDTDMGEATPSEDDRKTKKKTIRGRGDEHRPLLREEGELQKLIDEHDDEDPMKDFLIEEKKKEVDEARRLRDSKSDSDRRHRHRPHRSHRSHRDEEGSPRRDDKDRDSREHRHRRRDDDGESRRGSLRERSDRDRERRRDDRDDGDSRDRRRDRDRVRDWDRDRDRTRDHDKESSHRRRDRHRKDDRDDQDRDRERRH